MTETTTAEQTQTIPMPDLDPQPAQNLPAVAPAAVPAQFEQFNIAVRRMLGLEDASDGEIELFFHVCHKSGLDPFNREVFMIGRNTEVDRWEPVNPDEPDGQKRKVKRWVTKYTIQTGINGFRKRAREIASTKDIEFSQDDPLWCGEDGVWKEVWTEKTAPHAAKFVLYRDGFRYSFIAHYSEYVQTNRDGNPNSMWAKMPRNQLRKCAEAGAIQAAFPDELGGLLLEDAVQNEPVVIDVDGDGNVKPEPKRRPRQGNSLRDRSRTAQSEVIEGEVDPEPAPSATADSEPVAADSEPKGLSEASRQKWQNRMFALFGSVQCTDREEQLAVIEHISEHYALEHRTDLTDDELKTVVNKLNAWDKTNTLGAEINKILGPAAEAAAASTQEGQS